jgi:hypothetical protein
MSFPFLCIIEYWFFFFFLLMEEKVLVQAGDSQSLDQKNVV